MTAIAGKCLLLFGLSFFGWQQGWLLRQRQRCLSSFLTAVEILERELSFRLMPVSQLLEAMEKGTGGDMARFFALCRGQFSKGGEAGLEEIWCSQLTTVKFPVSPEDLRLFGEVGGILGQYDADSQRGALSALRGRLEREIEGAGETSARMGRVYGTLGVTLGLFCVILL